MCALGERVIRGDQRRGRGPVSERYALAAGPDGAERLAAAGMTWEALAGWLHGPLDAAVWEAVIPSNRHIGDRRAGGAGPGRMRATRRQIPPRSRSGIHPGALDG